MLLSDGKPVWRFRYFRSSFKAMMIFIYVALLGLLLGAFTVRWTESRGVTSWYILAGGIFIGTYLRNLHLRRKVSNHIVAYAKVAVSRYDLWNHIRFKMGNLNYDLFLDAITLAVHEKTIVTDEGMTDEMPWYEIPSPGILGADGNIDPKLIHK
jgi:hypothetical protein